MGLRYLYLPEVAIGHMYLAWQTSLSSKGVFLDLIGSDELAFPKFRSISGINFLNLRGSSDPNVSFGRKVFRVCNVLRKVD